MNENSLVDVLKFLSEKLDGCKWAVYGSLNLKLQGLDIDCHNVDISTTLDCMVEIDKRLFKFSRDSLHKVRKAHGEFYRNVYEIDGLEVEVIADISWFKNGSLVRAENSKFENLVYIECNGIKVPCYSLEDEYEGYRMLNRERDKEKIRFIEERIFS